MSRGLLTSLSEIRSFNPCASGWRAILVYHPHETAEDMLMQFPLVDCVASNSISDVCWLLGKRKVEIQICVRFARMCADSVQHLNNRKVAADAATYAAADAYAYAVTYAADAAAATYAAADDAAAYAATYDAADAADAAADAADAADAATYAAADAYAYAVTYAADAYAYDKQTKLNKSFLIKCINEFEKETT